MRSDNCLRPFTVYVMVGWKLHCCCLAQNVSDKLINNNKIKKTPNNIIMKKKPSIVKMSEVKLIPLNNCLHLQLQR